MCEWTVQLHQPIRLSPLSTRPVAQLLMRHQTKHYSSMHCVLPIS